MDLYWCRTHPVSFRHETARHAAVHLQSRRRSVSTNALMTFVSKPLQIVRGACGHDCPDTCSWVVEVRDGIAERLSGDSEHPFTRGTLCAKENHYLERVYQLRGCERRTPLGERAHARGAYRLGRWQRLPGCFRRSGPCNCRHRAIDLPLRAFVPIADPNCPQPGIVVLSAELNASERAC